TAAARGVLSGLAARSGPCPVTSSVKAPPSLLAGSRAWPPRPTVMTRDNCPVIAQGTPCARPGPADSPRVLDTAARNQGRVGQLTAAPAPAAARRDQPRSVHVPVTYQGRAAVCDTRVMTAAPVSTYRLQLQPGFGFAAAGAIADYLADLGVTHAYLSPILQAAPGSTHGYDVVDHSRVSADLGGGAEARALVDRVRRPR